MLLKVESYQIKDWRVVQSFAAAAAAAVTAARSHVRSRLSAQRDVQSTTNVDWNRRECRRRTCAKIGSRKRDLGLDRKSACHTVEISSSCFAFETDFNPIQQRTVIVYRRGSLCVLSAQQQSKYYLHQFSSFPKIIKL